MVYCEYLFFLAILSVAVAVSQMPTYPTPFVPGHLVTSLEYISHASIPYQAPRCLYIRDGIRSGYWTSPYFDTGAGRINMVT